MRVYWCTKQKKGDKIIYFLQIIPYNFCISYLSQCNFLTVSQTNITGFPPPFSVVETRERPVLVAEAGRADVDPGAGSGAREEVEGRRRPRHHGVRAAARQTDLRQGIAGQAHLVQSARKEMIVAYWYEKESKSVLVLGAADVDSVRHETGHVHRQVLAGLQGVSGAQGAQVPQAGSRAAAANLKDTIKPSSHYAHRRKMSSYHPLSRDGHRSHPLAHLGPLQGLVLERRDLLHCTALPPFLLPLPACCCCFLRSHRQTKPSSLALAIKPFSGHMDTLTKKNPCN